MVTRGALGCLNSSIEKPKAYYKSIYTNTTVFSAIYVVRRGLLATEPPGLPEFRIAEILASKYEYQSQKIGFWFVKKLPILE